MKTQRLAIFASGTGSNALNIIDSFKSVEGIEVAFVLSNNPDAGIIESAKNKDVNVIVCSNKEAASSAYLINLCENEKVDWIMLAGYLRLIPSEFIQRYTNRIVNLHPSLLPHYGGKGMYGHHVHEAVIRNQEKQSGITIHFVNEKFDEGKIIAQFHCAISSDDDVDSLAKKIHVLEQSYVPTVLKNTILKGEELF